MCSETTEAGENLTTLKLSKTSTVGKEKWGKKRPQNEICDMSIGWIIQILVRYI